jgi:hypothetical protein
MDDVPEEELCGWSEGIKFHAPKLVWRWYVFGGRGTGWIPMMVDLPDGVPLWQRVLTRIFLRSQWERLP